MRIHNMVWTMYHVSSCFLFAGNSSNPLFQTRFRCHNWEPEEAFNSGVQKVVPKHMTFQTCRTMSQSFRKFCSFNTPPPPTTTPYSFFWTATWKGQFFSWIFAFWVFFRIIGSAEALPILCVRWERERERERERYIDRWKWRHLSSAEIGDEFCTFPCQKFAR